ncbi:Icc-related predicted phosphoesterase [Deinococcus yavapaiensis KR-236]|uniref:Icc-related predicted phosphoesterase n=1 Tax=Deinococcus yavapaiensis KR-236 TaxID=694435 RepID=A0A318S4K0_9DEIO|nr:Icc-related predicted phosphoesterase [Deinococcus yavapaiensis KR-236]
MLLSDTHGCHRDVRVPDGDVLVHAGDATHAGSREELEDFLAWFASIGNFEARVLVAGNHDVLFERDPILARSLLPRNVTYLEDAGVTVRGVRVWGSPITPVFEEWAFIRAPREIDAHWRRIPRDVDVLVTHGPPLGVLDRLADDSANVGCPSLLARVNEVRPRLHVHGHIHARYGQLMRGATLHVNPAVCDDGYAAAHAPIVVNLEARMIAAR